MSETPDIWYFVRNVPNAQRNSIFLPHLRVRNFKIESTPQFSTKFNFVFGFCLQKDQILK